MNDFFFLEFALIRNCGYHPHNLALLLRCFDSGLAHPADKIARLRASRAIANMRRTARLTAD